MRQSGQQIRRRNTERQRDAEARTTGVLLSDSRPPDQRGSRRHQHGECGGCAIATVECEEDRIVERHADHQQQCADGEQIQREPAGGQRGNRDQRRAQRDDQHTHTASHAVARTQQYRGGGVTIASSCPAIARYFAIVAEISPTRSTTVTREPPKWMRCRPAEAA